MTRASMARNVVKHRDVEELEMLLEAYFVQIDGTMNKLSTVRISIIITIPVIYLQCFKNHKIC